MAGGQGFVASPGSVGRVVTVALVGVAIATAAGNVATDSPDRTVGLNGLAVASQQGYLKTGRGQEFSVAIGDVENVTAAALAGQNVGIGQGSLAVEGGSSDRTAELAGQAVTATAGDLFASEYSDVYIATAQGSVGAVPTVALVGLPINVLQANLDNVGAPLTLPLFGQEFGTALGIVGVVQRRNPLVGIEVMAATGDGVGSVYIPPPAISVGTPLRRVGRRPGEGTRFSGGRGTAGPKGGGVGRKN